jgi:hypothetical protein
MARNFIEIVHSAWHEPISVFYEFSGKATNLINLADAIARLGDSFFQNPATDALICLICKKTSLVGCRE